MKPKIDHIHPPALVLFNMVNNSFGMTNKTTYAALTHTPCTHNKEI